ncbi:polysaccharide deacetylase family protein [Paenibacillus sp. GCM10027626]|uniref:polysaccharide deacetylase family protein n=1 Tax=Paenibacillus sp. GCM10027626 TaxID=3273411 RepID=UPI003630D8CC
MAVFCCICLIATTGFSSIPAKHGRAYYESRGEVIWDVPTDEKVIALTFDDGPNPKTTPKILDLLKKYDAKATFFVIGFRMDRFPDIVKREVAEGHEIANHTNDHVYFKRSVGQDTIDEQLRIANRKIKELAGQTSPWFRPPGGFYNDKVISAAKRHGQTVVLWSWNQDTRDWSSPGVRKIVDKVLRNAQNGNIVLLHDHVSGSRTQTVKALEIILPELKKRGYRMVTVSELMKYRRPAKANGHQDTAAAQPPSLPDYAFPSFK